MAAVKLQVAWFERLGPPGVAALAELLQAARERGLLTIADAKRSDIAATGAAYAEAWLGEDAPLAADALTLSPYLGLDSLEPFAAAAERAGAGLFVLVRTSNPGARDYQDLHVGALRVYERLALSLAPLAKRLLAPRSGWSSLGAVVGATWLAEARQARELLPRSLFLVPGYGAQGASAREAVGGFVPGPNGLEGGLVNASRSLLFPKAAAEARDAGVWEAAIDASLERSIAELSEAVAHPKRG